MTRKFLPMTFSLKMSMIKLEVDFIENKVINYFYIKTTME